MTLASRFRMALYRVSVNAAVLTIAPRDKSFALSGNGLCPSGR